MKLCIVTYAIIAKKDGRWLLNDKFGNLVEKLAPHFERIVFLASAPTQEMEKDSDSLAAFTYTIHAQNVDIIALPPSSDQLNPIQKLLISLRRLYPFYSYIKYADFVYITMPGFSPFFAQLICRMLKKPYGLYFGSDWQEVAPFMSKWHGLWGVLMHLYVTLSYEAEKTAVRHSQFTVVHGKKVFDKFTNEGVPVIETVPLTLVSTGQFFDRDDTCVSKPNIKILYVGSLIQRKGIEYLLDACHLLTKRGYNMHLQLVGTGDKKYISTLKQRTKLLQLEQKVNFAGYMSDLDDLLKIYRQADIFVLPSQGEGFPRVLYEAMSQSVPVVATEISTISAVLQNKKHALLVPPRSAENLAEGIENVIVDDTLRQTIIRSGFQFAKKRIGVDDHSSQLIELINTYGSVKKLQ